MASESSGELAAPAAPAAAQKCRPPHCCCFTAAPAADAEDGIKYSSTTGLPTGGCRDLQMRSEASPSILGRGLNEGLRYLVALFNAARNMNEPKKTHSL